MAYISLCICVCNISSYGGVVKNALQNEFGIGAVEYANIGSMYFYAYFIMQIPSGVLADKLGPKKTVSIFSVLAAIGSIIFGMAPNIIIAYIARFMVGIGVSVVFICLVKIQSRWFYSKNFALMIGLSGVVANLGAMLAQTPLAIVSGKFGWRKTFIFMGTYGVSFLRTKYSLTNVQSANYVIVTIVGSLISCLVLGQISDHFKSRKLPLTIVGTLTLIC